MVDDGTIQFTEIKAKAPKLSIARAHPKHPYCQHIKVLVDDEKAELECKDCHEKINPMWFLSRIAREESNWLHRYKELRAERKLWEARRRTRCRHCGKFNELTPALRSEVRAQVVKDERDDKEPDDAG